MITMGQAVDAVIKYHEQQYQESKVYNAEVDNENVFGVTRVSISASHFSTPLIYYVKYKTAEMEVSLETD